MNDPETILLIAWLVISAILLAVTARALKDSTEVMRLQQEHAISIQELARILEAPPHKVQELTEATNPLDEVFNAEPFCKVCEDRCCIDPSVRTISACGCSRGVPCTKWCSVKECQLCKSLCECEPE